MILSKISFIYKWVQQMMLNILSNFFFLKLEMSRLLITPEISS